jgi:hypothetical protein
MSRFLLPLFLLLLSTSAYGVTYVVPSDAEMIQRSDDIVVATGVTSLVERSARGAIVTRATLRIEEVLKGDRAPGQQLVLTERGGILGGVATWIPGTPRYQPGRRYLVFTESDADGEPVTYGMSLGQFVLESPLALRMEIEGFDQNLEPYRERARDAAGFLAYIRGIVTQSIGPEAHYFVDMPRPARPSLAAEATRGSYLMTDGDLPFRWANPSATIVHAGQAAGADAQAGITLALGQWNSTATNIDYRDGGADETATGGISAGTIDTSDGKNAILLGDPNGQAGSGVAGIGGITAAALDYTFDGEEFWDIAEVDVVMNDITFAQTCFNTVLTHELGHTLGFRHSNQNQTNDRFCQPPLACTSDAIMNSSVTCGWNGVLKEYDLQAAETVYGNGVACTPAAITSSPASQQISLGEQVSLRVEALGTLPLDYQWYEGARGDTAKPVGGNRLSFLTPASLAATTSYWVRVTNSCGSADSEAAVVTVLRPRRRAVGHP